MRMSGSDYGILKSHAKRHKETFWSLYGVLVYNTPNRYLTYATDLRYTRADASRGTRDLARATIPTPTGVGQPTGQSPMSPPQRTAMAAPVVTLPLTKIESFYFTDVKVNGKPFQFTLETGASFFAVSRRLANVMQLKIDTVEMAPGMLSPRVRIDSVNIGGVTLHGLVARIEPSFDGRNDDGIISIPMLRNVLWTMDLTGLKLVLERGSLPAPNGKDVFQIVGTDRGRRIDIPLTVGGQAVSAVLDSRYADWIMVSDSLIPKLDLGGPLRSVGTAWGPNQGTFEMRGARLTNTVNLGAYAIPRAPLVFRDRAGAIVGNAFLEEFVVTVDYPNQRVRFLRPAGTTITVPPLAWETAAVASGGGPGAGPRATGAPLRSGDRTFGFRMAMRPNSGALTIVQLAPGSAAEQMGIRENDRVVEFDGRPVSAMDPSTFRAALERATPVKIIVERDGKRLEFTVTSYVIP